MPRTPRTFRAYECDHLRPLVRVEGIWRHVLPEGDVGGWCSAGAYGVTATYEGEHYVSRLVQALENLRLNDGKGSAKSDQIDGRPMGEFDAAEAIWKAAVNRDARHIKQLRKAIHAALSELGVPTPDYPAPVARAVEILTTSLTFDGLDYGSEVQQSDGDAAPCAYCGEMTVEAHNHA